MKLTLEQKAFYEYGRAVESLKRTIYETRETAIQEFKDPYRLLSTYDRKQLIDAIIAMTLTNGLGKSNKNKSWT